MNRMAFGWIRCGLVLGLVAVGLSGGWVAEAQAAAGCTLQKQVYTCDRAQFREAMAKAATGQVDSLTAGKDRMVAGKLRDLIASLGKSAPAEGVSADLTFSLIPVATAGVLIGPAGVELAVLRVYGPRAGPSDGASSRGPLLWAESFTGQPDLSWPATVQATINQFRAGLKP